MRGIGLGSEDVCNPVIAGSVRGGVQTQPTARKKPSYPLANIHKVQRMEQNVPFFLYQDMSQLSCPFHFVFLLLCLLLVSWLPLHCTCGQVASPGQRGSWLRPRQAMCTLMFFRLDYLENNRPPACTDHLL